MAREFGCHVTSILSWLRRAPFNLVTQALDTALMTRKPQLVIHHSDQGSQLEFGKRCAQMGIRPLKGSVGDAYADLEFCHNDFAGSLFATLECELIDRRVWETQTQARLAVFTSIEG